MIISKTIEKFKDQNFDQDNHLKQLILNESSAREIVKIESSTLYTLTEIIHDTTPSYRLNYLPGRYNQKLLLPTKMSLDQNNQVLKKLNLIQ